MSHSKKSSQGWPFHAAERAVHERLGVTDDVAHYGLYIRAAMPDQHRAFFSGLPYVLLAAVDGHGYPWAMPVFDPQRGQGNTAFVTSPTHTALTIRALPTVAAVLGVALAPQDKVGVLGIQLSTRRRNRMNGVVRQRGQTELTLAVDQSFGNCPKYIQLRDLQWRDDQPTAVATGEVVKKGGLNTAAKQLIHRADTFFIASRTSQFEADARTGVDVSHRGGKPGFVKVEANALTFPDFVGNQFFNTLGNIESDGRVGLFFPDFERGDALYVSGRAQVVWEGDEVENFAGAERLVRFHVERWLLLADHLPMRGQTLELSPFLHDTGEWLAGASPALRQDLERRKQRPVQGVDASHVHDELFGAAGLDEPDSAQAATAQIPVPIEFSRAGKVAQWSPQGPDLLSFAEAQGLTPNFGCRRGRCGACACDITQGHVVYSAPLAVQPKRGQVLICCAKPAKGSGPISLSL